MTPFSASECIQYGWHIFKKRAGFFIGVSIVLALITMAIGAIPLVGIIAGILVKMGSISFSFKAYEDPMSAKFSDLWAPYPFWKFVLASLLLGVVIVLGLILFIIPGIIFMLRYLFVQYLVMDRKLGAFEAMKESARITRGNHLNLLVFIILIMFINILGALCLGVGLLVSIPVTLFAVVRAYRVLEHAANEVVPAAA